jgi:hypothetical protein
MLTNEQRRILATALVQHFDESEFVYAPKRNLAHSSVKGWHMRLAGYCWSGQGIEHHQNLLNQLSMPLGQLSQKLVRGESIGIDEQSQAITLTTDLFRWGGVLRGMGHNPSDFQTIKAVMLTAVHYRHSYSAPLDSAWTKLAAISSSWNVQDADCPPQVIFDSRVSVSLLTAIENCAQHDASLLPTMSILKSGYLGTIPGRGGNRPRALNLLAQKGWKSRYRVWSAQFEASKLVSAMATVLNEKVGPVSLKQRKRPWTTRDVEMVLFMDGY